MNTQHTFINHMPNQHPEPMESVPIPYIKCGESGVICRDLHGFSEFCRKLFGYKKSSPYEKWRNQIERKCEQFGVADMTYAVIGHVCEMAYGLAIKKGGWEVDNHVAYLMEVANNNILRENKNRVKHSHRDLDNLDYIPAQGDGYRRAEDQDMVHKGIRLLQELYPSDALIIIAMLKGYDNDNHAMARVLDRENDAVFRKAKQRAKERFRRILLDLMGRRPDGPGDGPGYGGRTVFKENSLLLRKRKVFEPEWNTSNNDFYLLSRHDMSSINLDFKLSDHSLKKRIDSMAHRSSSAQDRYTRFIRLIFDELTVGEFLIPMNGTGFRTKPEWLQDAA